MSQKRIDNLALTELQKSRAENEALMQINRHLRGDIQREKFESSSSHGDKSAKDKDDDSVASQLRDSFRDAKDSDRAAQRLLEQQQEQERGQSDSGGHEQIVGLGRKRHDVDFTETTCSKEPIVTKSDIGYTQIQCDPGGKPELWNVGLDGKLLSHKSVGADKSVTTESFRPSSPVDWTKPDSHLATTPSQLDLKAARSGQFLESVEKDFPDRHFQLTGFEPDGKGGALKTSFTENDLHRQSQLNYYAGKMLSCKITQFDSSSHTKSFKLDGVSCDVERLD